MEINTYKCLKRQIFDDGPYSLMPFREEDIFLIMTWRNEQMDILRQKRALTPEMQQRYYDEIIKPTFSQDMPAQILFSFLCEEKCIGYGGLVHIDWDSRRGEMSFLVDTKRINDSHIYKKDFTVYIGLFKIIIFEVLGFNRIYGETYDIRANHIAIMEQNGFILEGRMREHVFIKGRYVDSLIHGLLKKDYLS